MAVELSLEANSFSKQMSSIDKAIKNSEKSFKQAGQGIKNYEKTYTGLDAKIQKTSKQLELYSTKLAKQKEEYSKLENTVESQKNKLNELESTLGKNSKEWQEQAKLVSQNSEKLVKLGTDINGTETKIGKLTNELNTAQKEFNELGQDTKTLSDKLEEVDRKTALAESELNKLASTSGKSSEGLKSLKNDMEQVSNKLEAGKQKISAYESEISKLSTELESSKSKHNSLSTEINKTETELNQAKAAYGENSTEVQQLKSKLLALKDEYNSVEKEINENERALDTYNTELNNTQAEVNELSRELNNMPFERVAQSMQNAGEKIKSVGQAMTATITAPTLAAGTAAGKMAYDYDQGLAKVGSLVQKSGKEMKEYDSTIKRMSKNTGISLSELTESMYQGISAGGDLNNIFKLTEVASKSAIAGFTSTDVAIDGLTSSMNAFGIEYEDVDKVANKFLLTQNKGKTSFGELASSIGKVAPTAKAAGVGLDELLSATAALTMNGVATSEAMTATKAALSNIIKPSTEAQKIAKKLGLEFNVTALQSKGLSKFLDEVKEKTGGNIETMGKLFGSTEALNAMLILTGEGAGTFKDILGEMDSELNLVDEAFNNMNEGSGAQFKLAINEIKVAITDLGDVLAPVIEFLAEKISDLANWFSGLDENTKQNIVTFGLLAAAIGPILSIIGQLIIVGGNAVTLFGGLSAGATAATGATTGLTGALGVLASPIGILGAVAALVGLMTIAGDSEKSILALQEKFGGLGYVIGAVCEFISGTVQLTFGNLIIIVQGAFDTIAAIMDGPGGQTVEDAQNRMHAKLTLNTEEAWMKITNTTSRGLSQMRAMNETELGTMISTTQTILNQIPSIVDGDYNTASAKMAHHLKVMSDEQLLSLTGMNDTTKMLFQGINSNMTVEEMSNQVSWNMKQMSAAGELEAKKLEKDITSAMNTLQKQVDSKTKQASQDADTNTKNLANKVDTNTNQADIKANKNTQQLANDINKNTQQASVNADKNTKDLGNKIDANTKIAGNKTNTNTQNITKDIDKNTKEASKIANTNTKDMAKEIDNNSKAAASSASKNANKMKNDVISATKQMANQAISDWNRIRNEYSRSISGRVNITKTTTNVVRTQQAQETMETLDKVARINISDYQLAGAYYSSNTKVSTNIAKSNINLDLRKIEKLLEEKEERIDVNLNFNFGKIEIQTDDEYKKMARKIAGYVDVELQKIKNKNRKVKGRLVNA